MGSSQLQSTTASYGQWRQRLQIKLTGRYPLPYIGQYPLSSTYCTVKMRPANRKTCCSNRGSNTRLWVCQANALPVRPHNLAHIIRIISMQLLLATLLLLIIILLQFHFNRRIVNLKDHLVSRKSRYHTVWLQVMWNSCTSVSPSTCSWEQQESNKTMKQRKTV